MKERAFSAFSLPVTKWRASEISDHPNRAGRRRKHQSDAERVRVFRAAQGLRKITIDVPTQFTQELRDYAPELRKRAAQRSTKLEVDTSPLQTSLEPKQAAASYVGNMRWKRTARGVYHLPIAPPYWIGGRVVKVPRREPASWQWEVEDQRFFRIIARGDATGLGRAKWMVAAIVQIYLEDPIETAFRSSARSKSA